MLSWSFGLVESMPANLPPKTQGGEGLAGFCQAPGGRRSLGNARFASFCSPTPAARAARRQLRAAPARAVIVTRMAGTLFRRIMGWGTVGAQERIVSPSLQDQQNQ